MNVLGIKQFITDSLEMIAGERITSELLIVQS